jgi:hypothetical protein
LAADRYAAMASADILTAGQDFAGLRQRIGAPLENSTAILDRRSFLLTIGQMAV